jgi:hypothetical protein
MWDRLHFVCLYFHFKHARVEKSAYISCAHIFLFNRQEERKEYTFCVHIFSFFTEKSIEKCIHFCVRIFSHLTVNKSNKRAYILCAHICVHLLCYFGKKSWEKLYLIYEVLGSPKRAISLYITENIFPVKHESGKVTNQIIVLR